MTRRELFERGRWPDRDLPINYNDVDYCLKLRDEGQRVVYDPDLVMLPLRVLEPLRRRRGMGEGILCSSAGCADVARPVLEPEPAHGFPRLARTCSAFRQVPPSRAQPAAGGTPAPPRRRLDDQAGGVRLDQRFAHHPQLGALAVLAAGPRATTSSSTRSTRTVRSLMLTSSFERVRSAAAHRSRSRSNRERSSARLGGVARLEQPAVLAVADRFREARRSARRSPAGRRRTPRGRRSSRSPARSTARRRRRRRRAGPAGNAAGSRRTAAARAGHLLGRLSQFLGAGRQADAEDRVAGRDRGLAQRLDHDLEALVLGGYADRGEAQGARRVRARSGAPARARRPRCRPP